MLKTFDDKTVLLAGKIFVEVAYEDQPSCRLPLIITKGADKAALFSLQWLESIRLDWNKVCSVVASLSAVLDKYAGVFSQALGLLKGVAAKIHVDASQAPKLFKLRSVPYVMKQKVELELDQLIETKVIEPVRYSEWSTAIVAVLKTDGSIRICGDYKLTVNRVSHLEQYPIPTLDDLCDKQYSKLDFSYA